MAGIGRFLVRFGPVVVLVLPLFAGCLSGPGPTATEPTASALPQASSVDLHTSLVAISMPGGNGTAVVLLNVSADQWIPADASVLGNVYVADPQYYTVCVLIQTFGLDSGNSVVVRFLELKGDELFVIGSVPVGLGFDDSSGSDCATRQASNDGRGMLLSETPRDVQLVALIATGEVGEKPIPPFNFTLGVGTSRCAGDVSTNGSPRVCGPTPTIASEPLARGPGVVRALYTTDSGCNGCGFNVTDARTVVVIPASPAAEEQRISSGRLILNRTGAIFPAFTIVGVIAGGIPSGLGPSSNHLTASLFLDGQRHDLDCNGVDQISLRMIGWSTSSSEVRVEWETQAGAALIAGVTEFPFDLTAMGWTSRLETAVANNYPAGRVPAAVECIPNP